MSSPRRGATGLWMRVGVVHKMGLGWRKGMGVMQLWLGRSWQWVNGQSMGVGVDSLHGALLIRRWFMVGLVVLVLLVVEATISFNGATCVSPARLGMMTMTWCAVVGHWEDRGERTLAWRRLRRKVAWGWGWGSALWPPRWCRHGLTDYRGVGNMGPGCCRSLGQLATASTRRTGPRG